MWGTSPVNFLIVMPDTGTGKEAGVRLSRNGVATTRIVVAQARLLCLSIVRLAIPTGRQAGLQQKSLGAAGITIVAVSPQLFMIAMQAFRIGSLVGQQGRRHGAAAISRVAARRRSPAAFGEIHTSLLLITLAWCSTVKEIFGL